MPLLQFFLSFRSSFSSFLDSSALIKVFSIILGTLILEDLTTVLTALAAQQNKISPALAIPSLWFGIGIGDILLYLLGVFCAQWPQFHRFFNLSEISRGKDYFTKNMVKIVVISRFVPGLRLPFYTCCGFFRTPLLPFTLIVAISTCLWTFFLFYLSFEAGNWILQQAQTWRWIGILGFLSGLFILKRLLNRFKTF